MTSNQPPSSLLVLAAGMGSRYGGLKQVDPIGPNGETLMDYSLYDARKAGFSRVVFLIREEMQEVFDQQIGRKYANKMEVEYAYQKVDDLPEGTDTMVHREKPWGTGHAVWCARNVLKGSPFAVINADDFYGAATFSALIDSISSFVDCGSSDGKMIGSMVGYLLKETLSSNGSVSRGICKIKEGNLQAVEEWSGIAHSESRISGKNTRGESLFLSGEETVSMNVWAFPSTVFPALEIELKKFIERTPDLTTDEFYLPAAVDLWIKSGRAVFRANLASCQWMGVTYREDKELVINSIQQLISKGSYPASIF